LPVRIGNEPGLIGRVPEKGAFAPVYPVGRRVHAGKALCALLCGPGAVLTSPLGSSSVSCGTAWSAHGAVSSGRVGPVLARTDVKGLSGAGTVAAVGLTARGSVVAGFL
jgi:hypothetical protein